MSEQQQEHLRFHLYCGKSRTQDIIRLATTAATMGVRIYIAQFTNDDRYEALESCPYPITVQRFSLPGLDLPHLGQPLDSLVTELSLRQVRAALASGRYDLVILDEVKEGMARRILLPEQVYHLIRSKPPEVELALA